MMNTWDSQPTFLQPRILKETTDWIATEKPPGVNTHPSGKPNQQQPELSWLHIVQNFLKRRDSSEIQLWPCYRLDRDTSGVIVFAKNRITAAKIFDHYQKNKVEKTYLLVSASTKVPSFREILHESEIRKIQGRWISLTSDRPNSRTLFQLKKCSPRFQVWMAQPRTGRTHQIRLHARDLGLTILGDVLYDGDPFPRLMLHCWKWSCPEIELECEPFPLFDRLGLLTDLELCEAIVKWNQKETLLPWLTDPLNTEFLGECSQGALHFYQLGPVLVWDIFPPKGKDQNHIASLYRHRLKTFSQLIQKPVMARVHEKGTPHPRLWESVSPLSSLPLEWLVKEHGYFLKLRSSLSGGHYGVFLDQKLIRSLIKSQCKGQKVLNLFCYTGIYSVAAAIGGASEVVSVDSHKGYLEWAKENFRWNDLDPSDSRFRWFQSDCLTFLQKGSSFFDWIINDPPVFGRGPKGEIFRWEKDWKKLLTLALQRLSPQGRMVVTCHHRDWSLTQWQSEVEKLIKNLGLLRAVVPLPLPSSFERATHQPIFAKCLLIIPK